MGVDKRILKIAEFDGWIQNGEYFEKGSMTVNYNALAKYKEDYNMIIPVVQKLNQFQVSIIMKAMAVLSKEETFDLVYKFVIQDEH